MSLARRVRPLVVSTSVVIGALAVPPLAAQPVDHGVVHWPFDEVGGLVAVDCVAATQGAVVGADPVDGRSGMALSFAGSGERVEFGAEAMALVGSLDATSVSVWFRYEDVFATQLIQPVVYFGNGDTADPDDFFVIEIGHRSYEPGIDATYYLYSTWAVDGKTTLCFDTYADVSPGEWHHFVATYGPSGNTGYLDGVEMVDRHYTFGGPADTLCFNDVHDVDVFHAGHGKTGDGQTLDFHDYVGDIDELHVYDRVLTPAEVAALHAAEANSKFAADSYLVDGPTGALLHLELDAGPEHAGAFTVVFAGISGSEPGIVLPGPWHTQLPLNFDVFTELVIGSLGAPPFDGFVGWLDGDGRKIVEFALPPLPPLPDFDFTFAYAVKPWALASNPVVVHVDG